MQWELNRAFRSQTQECDTNLSHLYAYRVVNTRRINATRYNRSAIPVHALHWTSCLVRGLTLPRSRLGRVRPDAPERSHSFGGGRAESTGFGSERGGVDALREKNSAVFCGLCNSSDLCVKVRETEPNFRRIRRTPVDGASAIYLRSRSSCTTIITEYETKP